MLSFGDVAVAVAVGVTVSVREVVWLGSGSIEATVRSCVVNGLIVRSIERVVCIVHLGGVEAGLRVRGRVRVVVLISSRYAGIEVAALRHDGLVGIDAAVE